MEMLHRMSLLGKEGYIQEERTVTVGYRLWLCNSKGAGEHRMLRRPRLVH